MKLKLAIVFFSASLPLLSSAESLSEISDFSRAICDKISASGTINRKKIEGSINADAKSVVKLIGGSVGIDGSITVENTEYEGLPYESLPEQMIDARDCRKEVARMLITERRVIEGMAENNKKVATYAVAKNGFDIFLMDAPNFKSLVNFESTDDKLFRLVENTSLELLEGEHVETSSGVPVPWRKVKVVSGNHAGKTGWIPLANIVQR